MTDRCSIASRVLPRVFILELICRWPLGYWPPISIPGNLLHDYSATWSTCHPFILELIRRWSLGYWPPITLPGDLLPDFSATRSTCHRASGPRGYLLLTSSTTDDRPDQTQIHLNYMNLYVETRLPVLKYRGVLFFHVIVLNNLIKIHPSQLFEIFIYKLVVMCL